MPPTPAMKERAATALSTLEPSLGGVRDFEETQPLVQLALAMIVRGLGMKRARVAVRRLEADYVDWNDVRVTPVRELAAKIGGEDAVARAERLVEFLGMVFLRFNRLALEWLSDPAKDTGGKKADRLAKWLGDRSLAHVVALRSWTQKSAEVNVDGGVPKVLQRLGLWDGKGGAAALRDHVRGLVAEADLMALVTILHGLAETTCVSPKPDCDRCPAKGWCPSAVVTKPVKETAAKPAKVSKAVKAAKPAKAPAKATAKPAVKAAKATKPAKAKAARKG